MSDKRGRPRSFDKDAALDLALPVFWRHGFHGASLSELTATMGLNKPSLYAAFGDKEALYLQALERYVKVRLPPHAIVLENEPDGRKAVERFLHSKAAMYCDPTLPGGCLVLKGASECSSPSTPAAVDSALRDMIQSSEALVLKRLQRAQREGQLPKNTHAKELAVYFSAVVAGLSLLARAGAKRSKLDIIVATAMSIWPKSSSQLRLRHSSP